MALIDKICFCVAEGDKASSSSIIDPLFPTIELPDHLEKVSFPIIDVSIRVWRELEKGTAPFKKVGRAFFIVPVTLLSGSP